ncbi:MAG: amino acid adenylation domain-containing protein, partial [Pseudomonadota bacterium]
MNINAFITWCIDKSISFSLDGNDQLKVNAAPGALTPAIISKLKERKLEIISWLKEQMANHVLPRPASDKTPSLSYAQQRLWLLDQIDGGGAHYNMPGALKLIGLLNEDALNKAFNSIFERHESLRTCFAIGEDEQPYQVIQTAVKINVPLIDLSMLNESARQLRFSEIIKEDVNHVFDLNNDLMLRAQLIKLADEEHALLVNMHHIASDGWSMSILINEFSALYSANVQGKENPLPPLAIQYADYSYWQRNWLKGEVLNQQLSYWTTQLTGLPIVHNLPSDHPRPPQKTFAGKTYVSQINSSIRHGLTELCQQEGGTLFMGLHAAFSAFLSRYSNETDIVIGSPIANREQAEIAGLIGFFVNTLVLRSDLSSNPSFAELLRQSKSTMINAYANQQVPFEQIVERLQPERSLSYSSLFQIMLVLQNNEKGELTLPGLTLSPVAQSYNTAKYDIRLDVTDTQNGLLLQWEYSTDLFEATTIARMAAHFELLLNALVKAPNENVFNLEMLSAQECQQLVDWNNTQVDYPNDKCIHEFFEVQVKNNPDAIAVTFENQQLTYQQLNQKANQLAHYLVNEKQVKPDTLVGICVERSLEMVIGILAILKAGGAYVPLDPEYSEARLKYMLEDANLTTVLTQRHLRETTPVTDPQAVCMDNVEFQQQLEIYPTTNPDLTQQGLHSNHLAYVIYTSGSTGNPKGVMVEHQALVNRIDWMNREYGSSPSDRILQKTPFSFDVSVWEFVWPLSVGAGIVLAKPEGHKDPVYLSALIRDQQITKLHFVPSMLGSMLALGDLSHCKTLRQVFCSGEALALHHVSEFQAMCPWAELHNLYGPTEAAIDVSYWDCAQLTPDLLSVPIGRPISNIQLVVLDQQLHPVPEGVAGELHIGGVGLARGYLNRVDLTAEKFIANPFYDNTNSSSSERLYKTGDLVRWLPDGNLEYLGRIDHQVKIRGFRIELGEIENALNTHPDVKDSVVLTKESEAGDTQLLAYIVPNENLQKVEHVVDVDATTFMFDDMYKNSLVENNDDPYSNFVGWNSSYDSQPIPIEEMEAWRTATVDRILELKPKRVLEIGIGSGLLFWKIVPECEAYWGTDLSNTTLQKLQAALNHQSNLAGKIELRQQEALDFSGLPNNFFDTVIINSVVQYFPDVNYLVQVLHSAVNLLVPNGNVFIGDVRNLRLLPMFQTAVQLSRTQDNSSLNLIKKLINTSVKREEELLLDPEFFAGFTHTEARACGVDLQVKTHFGNNELTCYRYDVVLRVDSFTTLSAKEFKVLVWGRDVQNFTELRKILSGSHSKGLRIRNIPNERIAAHNDACRQFEKATNLAELKTLLTTGKQSAFDIEAFARCASESGYILRVTLGSKGHNDLLDIIFIRAAHLSKETALVDVYDSTWSEGSSLHHYANNPRLGSLHIKLIKELREYVQQHLPDYMEPNNFVILDALPLTPNGKVDRKGLIASDVEYLQTTYIAPRTETEKMLCEIWQEMLGVERVGLMDNFFHLGGHSLSATRVIARINQTLNVSLPLKELFNTQTLAGLAQTLHRLDPNLARPALLVISRDEVLLPSFTQQRLWLLDQIDQGSAHYNMPSALKLTGKLDCQALNRALDSIIERHESLRTCFAVDVEGQPIQVIQTVAPFIVSMTDLSTVEEGERQLQLAEFVTDESRREFDLRRDVMLRAQLIKIATDEHILLVTMHHIASDGWSMSILINEFSALYSAYIEGKENPLPLLAIQYADYAHWQRNWLQGEVLDQQLGYWTKQLASLPVVHSLPLDHPRPAMQSFAGAIYSSHLDASISKSLNNLCQSQGATLFMGLHAAFSVLLSRYSNETDIVVGSPIANREQEEVAGLIGFFVNTLVLRSDLSESPSFTSLLNQ